MSIRNVVWFVLFAWFGLVVTLGSAGLLARTPGSPPWIIGLAATMPVVLFLLAYRGSSSLQNLVLSANLRVVAGVQAWRMGGFLFIGLYAHSLLPGLFAWPAGLGDMAVALAAPWMVARLASDRAFAGSSGFVLWNYLGILDLAVALVMGTLSSGFFPGLVTVTTAPMAQMPLVLIPAYFVPLFIILHIVSLIQARRVAVQGSSHFHAGHVVGA